MGAKGQTVEDEIQRRANEWMEAVRRKDLETLESLLAPEYALQAPGIGRMPRDQWLTAVSVYDIRSFEFEDVQVHLYGDTAVMRSRYTQKATYNGGDRSAEFHVTDVWVRRDGQWQVVTRHTSV
jgi:ketosteroid isomerase-like protein